MILYKFLILVNLDADPDRTGSTSLDLTHILSFYNKVLSVTDLSRICPRLLTMKKKAMCTCLFQAAGSCKTQD